MSFSNNKVEIISGKFVEGLRPIIGSFEFLQEPEPLKEITFRYTLTVAEHERLVLPDGDWEIVFKYDHKNIKLLSDSIISWNGFHQPGDQIDGEITFIILTSGFHGFDIGIQGRGTCLKVRWTLDEDGGLHYLGDPGSSKERTHVYDDDCFIRCTFFTEEKIHIIQSTTLPQSPYNLFKYDTKVEPTFRVGDTSTVIFNLESLKNNSMVSNTRITVNNFEVISFSPTFPDFISIGDSNSFFITVVPQPANAQHSITLFLEHPYEHNPNRIVSQIIGCRAIFNDDGSLRFVSEESIAIVKKDILPSFSNNIRRFTTEIEISIDKKPSIKKYEY